MEQATLKLLRDSAAFAYPLLLYCGAENSHQPVHKVQRLFTGLGSRDKTFRCFPNGYHSLHLDEECQAIKEESLRWMLARLPGQTFAKLPQLRAVDFRPPGTWRRRLGALALLLLAFRVLRWVARVARVARAARVARLRLLKK